MTYAEGMFWMVVLLVSITLLFIAGYHILKLRLAHQPPGYGRNRRRLLIAIGVLLALMPASAYLGVIGGVLRFPFVWDVPPAEVVPIARYLFYVCFAALVVLVVYIYLAANKTHAYPSQQESSEQEHLNKPILILPAAIHNLWDILARRPRKQVAGEDEDGNTGDEERDSYPFHDLLAFICIASISGYSYLMTQYTESAQRFALSVEIVMNSLGLVYALSVHQRPRRAMEAIGLILGTPVRRFYKLVRRPSTRNGMDQRS